VAIDRESDADCGRLGKMMICGIHTICEADFGDDESTIPDF